MPSPLLKQLFEDLDKENLRIARPSRFIFLCGGRTDENSPKTALSLRQYLLNERKIGARLRAEIVLAEKANQLYRDTAYKDLISFEEDIAQISASVMVITESPGSLAELGAFTANEKIRPHVAIISQTDYSHAESFVRYGPIKRIENDDEDRVAFIPWTRNKLGHLVKYSAASHVSSITKFINRVVGKVPSEESYDSATSELQTYIRILWLLHICTSLSITELRKYYVDVFSVEIGQDELKNRLYCMKLAGWVDDYSYINKGYWFSVHEADPFSKYRYKPGVAETVTITRKLAISAEVKADLKHPRQVFKHVMSNKVRRHVAT